MHKEPHNDYLLILSEYGALGGVLFLLPSLLVLWRAIRHWRAEPDRVRLKSGEDAIMPPTKFFLSIGLAYPIPCPLRYQPLLPHKTLSPVLSAERGLYP